MSFRSIVTRLLGACLATTLAGSALAQTPPIKPGLWEVRSERDVDGTKKPQPAANLQNLPPEVRAKVEAMMKEKGIAMGSNGVNKICMNKESLDPARWLDLAATCKTDYLTRTSSNWKWHSVCTQPPSQSDGEAVFSSPESYTVTTALTMTLRGETKTTHSIVKSKWLGADCGDLKPFTAQALKR